MIGFNRRKVASVYNGGGGGDKTKEPNNQINPMTKNGKRVRMIRERAMRQAERTSMRYLFFPDTVALAIRKNGRKDGVIFLLSALFMVFLFISCCRTEAAEVQVIGLEKGAIGDAAEQLSDVEVLLMPVDPQSNFVYGNWENMGELDIAAYCNCQGCVEVSDGYRTYSGVEPVEGVTVAANLEMFPIGTRVKLGDNGIEYVVEDKISSDSKEKISIYFENHEDAIQFGRQRMQVSRQMVIDETGPGERLGVFSVTGYCGCDQCTSGDGITYLGIQPKSKHTIAVDPSVIPLGSVVYINGASYTAEDTGSKIQGNSVDIYFDSHEEAVEYGKQEHIVYKISGSE